MTFIVFVFYTPPLLIILLNLLESPLELRALTARPDHLVGPTGRVNVPDAPVRIKVGAAVDALPVLAHRFGVNFQLRLQTPDGYAAFGSARVFLRVGEMKEQGLLHEIARGHVAGSQKQVCGHVERVCSFGKRDDVAFFRRFWYTCHEQINSFLMLLLAALRRESVPGGLLFPLSGGVFGSASHCS